MVAWNWFWSSKQEPSNDDSVAVAADSFAATNAISTEDSATGDGVVGASPTPPTRVVDAPIASPAGSDRKRLSSTTSEVASADGDASNKRAKTVSNDDLGAVTIDVMEKEQAAKSDTDVEVEDSKLSGAFEQYELCEDVYENVVETLNKSLY